MRLYLLLYILLPYCLYGQEVKLGKVETNNKFYLVAELDGDEIDFQELFLDQSVWYCDIDIYQGKNPIRHITIVQTPADTIRSKSLNLDTLIAKGGEAFFFLKNRNPEYPGYHHYKQINFLNGFEEGDSYVDHGNPIPKNYNFYKSTQPSLSVGEYTVICTIKVQALIFVKRFIISGKQLESANKQAQAASFKQKNWFNWEKQTGMYNGNKLYLGARGGIYYLESGQKVYVTNEVKSWK